jgi:hypothetical protein
VLPPVVCQSEKGWYWEHTYPNLFAHVIVTNGEVPGFLVGKVEPISAGVLRAEIQCSTGGYMKTKFPDCSGSVEAT